jgi:hypothetical protein
MLQRNLKGPVGVALAIFVQAVRDLETGDGQRAAAQRWLAEDETCDFLDMVLDSMACGEMDGRELIGRIAGIGKYSDG